MKVRVVYKDDGSVAVIHPAPKSRRPDESEEDWLERVFTKAMKDGGFLDCKHDDLDESALPSREYRDAWEGRKGDGISVSQEKADRIARERAAPAGTVPAPSGEGKSVEECESDVQEYLRTTRRSPAKSLLVTLLKSGLITEEDVRQVKSLSGS